MMKTTCSNEVHVGCRLIEIVSLTRSGGFGTKHGFRWAPIFSTPDLAIAVEIKASTDWIFRWGASAARRVEIDGRRFSGMTAVVVKYDQNTKPI
jgi:hypothetical protein